ncbi:sialic acid-binding Ig-like lectin 13 [Rhinatrema bivittatum]|uniref:sialic acid-binding Ig-like lectin 13 n=1 Tax=Rhinatrema bivittatum TaxID=194408 RepID=UPI001129AAE0|nr:sialic acid-binding Ig-like lectin 13 [Rhinatrema bivittatum]
MLEPDVTLTINCTAPGRCAGTAPIITWIEALTTPNSTTNTTSSHNDGTFSYSSSFTFTTSTDDHRKTLTCLVHYPGVKMSTEKTVTLYVKSSPCHDRHTVHYLNVTATVEDQEGLCVVIICQFSFPLDVILGKHFHGFWFREGEPSTGIPVASTNRSRNVDELTRDRFNIIGNISKCDCTLRIDDAMKEDSGRYYFRFEGGHMHSYISQPTTVTITDLLKQPEFSIQIPELLEPDVTLMINCTAPGRCAGTTPIITWIGDLTSSNSTNNTASYKYKVFIYSASFTFTTSLNDNGKTLTCRVDYPGVNVSTEKTVTLNVNVQADWPDFGDWLKSNCKARREKIICTCWIRSNPPPVLLWLINEEIVTGNYSNRTMQVLSGSYEYKANSTLTFQDHRKHNKSTVNIQCLNANKQGSLQKIYKELGSEIITWIICGTVIIVSLTALACFICGNKIMAIEKDIAKWKTAQEQATTVTTSSSSSTPSSSSTVDESNPTRGRVTHEVAGAPENVTDYHFNLLRLL